MLYIVHVHILLYTQYYSTCIYMYIDVIHSTYTSNNVHSTLYNILHINIINTHP